MGYASIWAGSNNGIRAPDSVVQVIRGPGDHFSIMKHPVMLEENLARSLSLIAQAHGVATDVNSDVPVLVR